MKDALQSDDESEKDDDESESGGEERAALSQPHRQRASRDKITRRRTDAGDSPWRDDRQQPVLTFRDVEESLETFSGDGNQSVRRWLGNFEETAHLCSWSDTQKLIYAKCLLRGSAKLYINFENAAAKWNKLKRALIDEFSKTMSSKHVH